MAPKLKGKHPIANTLSNDAKNRIHDRSLMKQSNKQVVPSKMRNGHLRKILKIMFLKQASCRRLQSTIFFHL